MKYIATFSTRAKKWFPRSVNSGKTVTTEELSEEISDSTVSAADVQAVLRAMRAAMTRHLCAGDKVKLDNIGTFYLTAEASGNGVAKEEDVTSNQINRVNVRFTPAKISGMAGQGSIPALAAGSIHWEKTVIPKKDKPTPTPDPDDQGGGSTPTPDPDDQGGGGTPTPSGDDEN